MGIIVFHRHAKSITNSMDPCNHVDLTAAAGLPVSYDTSSHCPGHAKILQECRQMPETSWHCGTGWLLSLLLRAAFVEFRVLLS